MAMDLNIPATTGLFPDTSAFVKAVAAGSTDNCAGHGFPQDQQFVKCEGFARTGYVSLRRCWQLSPPSELNSLSSCVSCSRVKLTRVIATFRITVVNRGRIDHTRNYQVNHGKSATRRRNANCSEFHPEAGPWTQEAEVPLCQGTGRRMAGASVPSSYHCHHRRPGHHDQNSRPAEIHLENR